MRQLIFFLTLALLPAAASAVILFNAGAEITATGAFPASKETQQGGLILYLKGDPDGATIDLETQPFRPSQGSIEWIPLVECSVTTLPAVCKVAVGQGAIRLNVTGGLGSPSIHAIAYEASAVVGEVGGAGGGTATALDWDQDGTLNVFERVADAVAFDLNDNGTHELEIKRQSSTIVDFLAPDITSLRFNPLGTATAGTFASGSLHGPSIGAVLGGAWRNFAPSETVATAVMNATDLTTGLGYSTEGGVAIIDNAGMVANFTATFVAISSGLTFAPPPGASPPTTCDGDTDGHLYDDTDQDLLCRCDGTTWAGVGGGATCT